LYKSSRDSAAACLMKAAFREAGNGWIENNVTAIASIGVFTTLPPD
jgi:hypothetical protein